MQPVGADFFYIHPIVLPKTSELLKGDKVRYIRL